MHLQVFTIQITPEYFESDQKFLNDFILKIKFVKSTAHLVVSGVDSPYWSVLLEYETTGKNSVRKEEKAVVLEESDLTPGGQYVLECLKQWRTEKASQLSIPKYLICHNSELVNIAFYLPNSVIALRKIKGFGEKKAEKYGEEILAVLNVI